jgi:hypothetical protein
MLSDPNGIPDDGRVIAFILTIVVCGLEYYWVVVLGKPWEPLTFCGAISALNVVYGILLRIRGDR